MLKRISLPIQLVIVLIFVFTLGGYVPKNIVEYAYTFSMIFKEFLGFFLPFIVFFFITAGILAFKKNAVKVLMLLIGSIFTSNIIVAMSAFLIGRIMLPFITEGTDINALIVPNGIEPLIKFKLPALVASEHAMLCALGLGIFFSFVAMPKVESFIKKGKGTVEMLLNSVFIPLIPIYVVGFLLKVRYEGVFVSLFQSYGKAMGLIIGMHWMYIILMYVIAKGSGALGAMKVSITSYLTAFSTMSSTAAIPVTVKCAEINTENKELAAVATPIMANVHLMGDSITTPILALVSTSMFLGTVPGVLTYIKFVFFFCLTMLAASGVPGGGIIVMIPILKSILGFTPEMVSIITTLYLLQDSFGTAANVMGDGGLMIIVSRWLRFFRFI